VDRQGSAEREDLETSCLETLENLQNQTFSTKRSFFV
jgi:hypothetical protein